MPDAIVGQHPLYPDWLKPENASVFDPGYRSVLRGVVRLLGLDDPTAIMGVGSAMETGAATGGLLDALAEKFPRFAQAIKAYHGSPHDFEKFDLSKIGTGEGAQAYGHGLYFAESPGTAQYYKEGLTQAKRQAEPISHAGQDFPPGTGFHRVLQDIVDKGKDATIADLERSIKFNASYAPDQASLQRHYLEFAQKVDPAQIRAPKGRMYEVNIHASPDQFLDWDKPLSQQPEQVKQAVAPYLQQIAATAANPEMKQAIETGSIKGSQIYHLIGGEQHIASGFKTPPPQAAAETLRQSGLPGLKYYDSGSRTAAGMFGSADTAGNDLTRNYVVFDDKLIEILKKYGLLLPAAGATGAAVTHQEKQ